MKGLLARKRLATLTSEAMTGHKEIGRSEYTLSELGQSLSIEQRIDDVAGDAALLLSVGNAAAAEVGEVGWEDVKSMVVERERVAVLAYAVLNDCEVVTWLLSPGGDLLATSRQPIGPSSLVLGQLSGPKPAEHTTATTQGLTARTRLTNSVSTVSSMVELCVSSVGARGRDSHAQGAGSRAAAATRRGASAEARLCLCFTPATADNGPRLAPSNPDGVALLARLRHDPAALAAAAVAVTRHQAVCEWLDRIAGNDSGGEGSGGASAALRAAAAAAKEVVGDWSELLELTDETLLAAGAADAGARAALLSKVAVLGDEDRVLKELYTLLVKPVEEKVSGFQDLLIVPDVSLWALPWAALKDAQGRYLIQRHSLRLAPSLAAAAAAAAGVPGSCGPVRVVGWGCRREYDPLPYASEEANSVALNFGVSPLVGERATAGEVARTLRGASWAHLACHVCLESRALILSPAVGSDPDRGRHGDSEGEGGGEGGLTGMRLLLACV